MSTRGKKGADMSTPMDDRSVFSRLIDGVQNLSFFGQSAEDRENQRRDIRRDRPMTRQLAREIQQRLQENGETSQTLTDLIQSLREISEEREEEVRCEVDREEKPTEEVNPRTKVKMVVISENTTRYENTDNGEENNDNNEEYKDTEDSEESNETVVVNTHNEDINTLRFANLEADIELMNQRMKRFEEMLKGATIATDNLMVGRMDQFLVQTTEINEEFCKNSLKKVVMQLPEVQELIEKESNRKSEDIRKACIGWRQLTDELLKENQEIRADNKRITDQFTSEMMKNREIILKIENQRREEVETTAIQVSDTICNKVVEEISKRIPSPTQTIDSIIRHLDQRFTDIEKITKKSYSNGEKSSKTSRDNQNETEMSFSTQSLNRRVHKVIEDKNKQKNEETIEVQILLEKIEELKEQLEDRTESRRTTPKTVVEDDLRHDPIDPVFNSESQFRSKPMMRKDINIEEQNSHQKNYRKEEKITIDNFGTEIDADDWIELFEDRAECANRRVQDWPRLMGNHMSELRAKFYREFRKENENLIREDSTDWWTIYRNRFIKRFGASNKREKALTDLRALKANDFKSKDAFFDACLKIALKTGDKTAATVADIILRQTNETFRRTYVMQNRDKMDEPIDQFIEKMKSVHRLEEGITKDIEDQKVVENQRKFIKNSVNQKPYLRPNNNNNYNRNIQTIMKSPPKGYQKPITTSSQQTSGDAQNTDKRRCFICQSMEHLAITCPQNRRNQQNQQKPNYDQKQNQTFSKSVNKIEMEDKSQGNEGGDQ